MTAEVSTVAWLLEPDGTVTPLVAARRSIWPGSATVTTASGDVQTVSALNVLSRDDLDRRYFDK
jgi:hypothetical protein